jgi:predicted acylesterase/phospholipase RssA
MYNFIDIDTINKFSTKYDNLVLSGGGVKGICHLGAIDQLVKKGLIDLKKLKNLAGTSVGSLIGCLIVLGFKIDEIWNFIVKIDFKYLFKPNIMNFLTDYGIEDGTTITDLIEQIIFSKTSLHNITFIQLYNITKISFHITGSCLTTKQSIVFNHTTTPDTMVSKAIRISISIPGFFTPITLNNNQYIDGGVLNNYPIDIFKDDLDRTIGIILCYDNRTDYDCPEQYFISIFNLFIDHYQSLFLSNTNHQSMIKIINTYLDISSCNFYISNENKQKLFKTGSDSVDSMINEWKIKYDDENF